MKKRSKPEARGEDDGVTRHFLSPLSREALKDEKHVLTPFMRKILQEHAAPNPAARGARSAKEVVEHILERKRLFNYYYLKIVCTRLEGEIILGT